MEDKKKFLDNNGLLYVWNKIKGMFDKKVDKEEGKVLSDNNLTDDLLEKINNAGTSDYTDLTGKPQINSHELASGNNTLEDLGIEIPKVPTNVGDFTNDVGYLKSEEAEKTYAKTTDIPDISNLVSNEDLEGKGYATETFVTEKGYQTSTEVQEAINKAVKGISGIEFKVEENLPDSGEKGFIYLISNNGKPQNIYDEYIWVEDKFEKIGTTDVDLSNYIKSEDLVAITNEEIDEIVILT